MWYNEDAACRQNGSAVECSRRMENADEDEMRFLSRTCSRSSARLGPTSPARIWHASSAATIKASSDYNKDDVVQTISDGIAFVLYLFLRQYNSSMGRRKWLRRSFEFEGSIIVFVTESEATEKPDRQYVCRG
ncbi:hypothetical protein P5V15_007688 [Pogonomyrmex californicus]